MTRWFTRSAALTVAAAAAAAGMLLAAGPAHAGHTIPSIAKLVNYKSKKCASVASYSTYLVTQRYCGSSSYHQRWSLWDRGSYYWLYNTNTGKCITARAVDEFIAHQSCDVGVARQKWSIIGVGVTGSGTGLWRIKNQASGRCLAVQGGSTSNGVRLIHWPCGGWSDHKWYFR